MIMSPAPVLKELKWLPVATQLYFRNAVMASEMLNIPCARIPLLSIHKAKRNKKAYHKKFTDAEYSAFQDCWWSKDVLL